MDRLIPYFFDITKRKDSQELLHVMMEFYEVEAITSKEVLTKLGDYFKHQIFSARMAVLRNRVFEIHKQGTGKTCLQMAILLQLLSMTSQYKKVIAATNKSLTESNKFEFVCKCTNGIFLERNEITGEMEINKKFKKLIDIKTHNQLYHMILEDETKKGKTAAQLNEDFKDVILFADELSKYILNDFAPKKGKGKDISFGVINKISVLNDITDIDDERIRDSNIKYVQLWRLTHACPTMKFFGLTGTPIANRPIEFFMLANLFLPLDQQYNLNEIADNIYTLTLDDFERLNGYISYVGKSANVAKEVFHGINIPHQYEFKGIDEPIDSKIVLYFKELYNVQAEALFKDGGLTNAKDANLLPQCFVDLNQNTGDDAVIDNDENEEETEELLDTEELNYDIKTTNLSIPVVRMKTCAILNEIAYKESQLFKTGNPGVAYVFNKLTKKVFRQFKKVFESYGFEVVSGKDLKASTAKKTICSVDSTGISGLAPNFKKPRVVFLDGEVSPEVREKVLKVLSSEENVHGHCIQVLVGSRIFEMGVNIGNDDRFYRICSEWSDSAEEQSKDRVLREDSAEHKKRHISKRDGIPIEQIKHVIDFYYFCPYAKIYFFHSDFLDFIHDANVLYSINDKPSRTNIDEEIYYRFDSRSVCHVIGFCRSGCSENIMYNDTELLGLPLFAFSEEYENPFEKLSVIFAEHGEELIDDIFLLGKEGYELIYSYCGMIHITNTGKDVFDEIGSSILLYTKGNFKEMSHPRIENTHMYVEDSNTFAITPAETFRDDPEDENSLNAIDVLIQVVSSAYYQYITMEEKSFTSSRIMRPVKQIAYDCIANLNRNILPSEYDYTSKCDYQKCEYECYAQVTEREEEPDDIISKDEPFWDNKELLYSADIIKSCTDVIIGFLTELHTISLDLLYSVLMEEHNYREYHVNKAILNLLKNRFTIMDKYGFPCYIGSNEDKIFLQRSVSNMITDCKQIPDIDVLTVVKSNQEFPIDLEVDVQCIQKIENIGMGEELSDDELRQEYEINRNLLKLYASQINLLERAQLRRICTNYYIDVDNYSEEEAEYLEHPIDRIIAESYMFYIFKLTIDPYKYTITKNEEDRGVPVFIHTLPKQELKGTKQNFEKRLVTVKAFRIFDVIDGVPQWRDNTKEEFEYYIQHIQEINQKHLNEELSIKIIQDGRSATIVSRYYSTFTKDEYKFFDTEQKRKSNGILYRNTKVEKIKPAIDYFAAIVDRDEYEGLDKLFDDFYSKIRAESTNSTRNIIDTFRQIFEVLNLIRYIDS